MKRLFPGYYKPTEGEFGQLWQDCVFIFDTNVLLNIYRYSPNTVERIFQILEGFTNRIWLPNQVALEYLSNRLSVISTQYDAYTDIERRVDTTVNSLVGDLSKYRKHPLISVPEIIASFQKAAQETKEQLARYRTLHPNLLETDVLWARITALFDDKVGEAYDEAELQQKYKEAEKRYNQKIPPGYADAKTKEVPGKYGDAILWLQILDHARISRKNVVFVTSETKGDWWLEHKGRTIGPRPELVSEIRTQSSASFYMYQMEQFITHAQDYLHLSSEPSVITEIKDVQRQQIQEQQAVLATSSISRPHALRFRSFEGEVGPILFDVNNDGHKELIIHTNDERLIELYIVTPDGLTQIEVEPAGISAPYLEDISLADIDNDEAKELTCAVAWEAGSGLVFYKNLNGCYYVMRGFHAAVGSITCFVDAQIQDYDRDGRLEIVSQPWDEIPEDLLPTNRIIRDPVIDEHPWGRVKYVWRWNPQANHFELLERTLIYIGGR